MNEVKWIKLSTDVFDSKKIRQIEALPDGDSIIVIWFKLLVLAGNTNDSGLIYFTKDIPYTEQMLATFLNRPLATVQLALNIFQSYGMIELIDDLIHVSNWEEYQNVEGLEKIREQTRLRVAKHRELKKLEKAESEGCNVTSNATVTQSNAIDKNRKDIDKNKSRFIPPTAEEVAEYCRERGNSIDPEEFIDFYTANGWVQGKGKPIKDWKACIRTWESKRKAEQPRKELDPNTIKRREKYNDLEKYYLGEE